MIRIIILVVLVFAWSYMSAQTNIVPNSSIEGFDGGANCVSVVPESSCGQNGFENRYLCYKNTWWAKVDNWEMADKRFSLKNDFPTPDRYCNPDYPSPGATDGEGYIHLRIGKDEGSSRRKEFCSVALNQTLIQGHRYLIKFKIASSRVLQPSDKVGLLISSDNIQQRGSGNIVGGIKGVSFIATNTASNTWATFQTTYTHSSSAAYGWISLGALHDEKVDDLLVVYYDEIEIYDIGPPQEPCPQIKLLQNNTFVSTIKEAADKLRAGSNVGAPLPSTIGEVHIASVSNVVFKAGEEVSLEPGFKTKIGANFLAYIAPCSENPCPGVSSLGVNEYEFCDNLPHTISSGFSPAFGHAIKWSPSTYLSADNIASPTFTPPTSGSNTIEYVVTFTDPCGNVASQIVRVSYTDQGVAPVINMNNLVNQEYELSFDLTMQSQSEWLEIEVKEKQTGTTVYYEGTQYYGSDYGTNLPFSVPCPIPGLSVCSDYEVIIRTKNNCHSGIATQTIDWNRSQFCTSKPSLTASLPNVFTPDGDGHNDNYCVQICGAENAEINVFNTYDDLIYESSVPVCSPNICLWNGTVNQGGSGSAVDGVYQVWLNIMGCGNNVTPTMYNVTILR